MTSRTDGRDRGRSRRIPNGSIYRQVRNQVGGGRGIMTETNFDDTAQRQFERQALSFEQNFEQFRDLNRLMW